MAGRNEREQPAGMQAGTTAEVLDFMREMMNIASGDAAVALSQLAGTHVTVTLPRIFFLPARQALLIFEDPYAKALVVKMRIYGDVVGYIFFIVPDEHYQKLMEMVEVEMLGARSESEADDLSAGIEVGNILAGVFLETVFKVSDLRIYHAVASSTVDMIHAALQEPLTEYLVYEDEVFMVEAEFHISESQIQTFMVLGPYRENMSTFKDAMASATEKMMDSD